MALVDSSYDEKEKVDPKSSRNNNPRGNDSSSVEAIHTTLAEEDPASPQDSRPHPNQNSAWKKQRAELCTQIGCQDAGRRESKI